MKRFLLTAILLMVAAAPALAQDTVPAAEVFAGYSYLRFNPGGGAGANFPGGWNFSIAGNVNPNVAIVADFAGHYRQDDPVCIALAGIPCTGRLNTNLHTFMGGPRFTARAEKVSPFAHVLGGFARFGTSGPGFSGSDTSFALGLGGGVDVAASETVSFRVIQADYLMTRFAGDTQNNVRLSFGIVFRFGER